MLAGLAFGSEIKRFGRSRMTRAAIVVLMLLPLVYGALCCGRTGTRSVT